MNAAKPKRRLVPIPVVQPRNSKTNLNRKPVSINLISSTTQQMPKMTSNKTNATHVIVDAGGPSSKRRQRVRTDMTRTRIPKKPVVTLKTAISGLQNVIHFLEGLSVSKGVRTRLYHTSGIAIQQARQNEQVKQVVAAGSLPAARRRVKRIPVSNDESDYHPLSLKSKPKPKQRPKLRPMRKFLANDDEPLNAAGAANFEDWKRKARIGTMRKDGNRRIPADHV